LLLHPFTQNLHRNGLTGSHPGAEEDLWPALPRNAQIRPAAVPPRRKRNTAAPTVKELRTRLRSSAPAATTDAHTRACGRNSASSTLPWTEPFENTSGMFVGVYVRRPLKQDALFRTADS